MTGARVFFWVQHLLGIGHLRRAALLASAMAESGFDVLLVSGGLPLRHLDPGGARVAQLPPVKAADRHFSALVDGAGRPLDAAFDAARRRRLMDLFHGHRPDAVITEMFPFGRRRFRAELLPLLDAARRRRPEPAILCSVRDVLNTKAAPERHREMAALARERFDRVMVHGDRALISFDATFPEAAGIAGRIRYTGYVAPPAPGGRTTEAAGAVVVSTGGGAVGRRLLETALAARPLSRLADAPWRLLAGEALAPASFARLRARAPAGVTVERARADFPALLAGAALSISQAGYNTVADLLRARVPTVLVPFAEARETEQTVRAQALAARGLARVVAAEALSPTRLAGAVDAAFAAGPPAESGVRLDGARTAARLLGEALAE